MLVRLAIWMRWNRIFEKGQGKRCMITQRKESNKNTYFKKKEKEKEKIELSDRITL